MLSRRLRRCTSIFYRFFFPPADTNMILHLLINQFRGLHERDNKTEALTVFCAEKKLASFPWWHTRCLAFSFPYFLSLPPMETDLYGEEMSSVRQRADEGNSRERRQKQTKAHSDPLMQEMEKKIRSTLFLHAPLERSPLLRLHGECSTMCVRRHINFLLLNKA